jgi:hypothetical protein
MADYGRVVERNKVRTIAAFDLGQFTYAPDELVVARGGVPLFPVFALTNRVGKMSSRPRNREHRPA